LLNNFHPILFTTTIVVVIEPKPAIISFIITIAVIMGFTIVRVAFRVVIMALFIIRTGGMEINSSYELAIVTIKSKYPLL
jgi:hypothetical protein